MNNYTEQGEIKKKKINLVREILAFIIIFCIGSMLTVKIFTFSYNILKNIIRFNTKTFSAILSLYSTLGMTIVVIVYLRFVEKRSFLDMGFTNDYILKNYIKGLINGFLIFLFIFIIASTLGGVKIISINYNINLYILIIIFIGFIIQGMSEELLLRSYFMLNISKNYSMSKAVILNSLLFSLLHIFNPGIKLIPLINIFLVGILFSLYFIKYKNIYFISAMHSMWNFTQANIFGGRVSGLDLNETILITKTNDYKQLISGGNFGIEGSIVSSIVLIIYIIKLIKDINNKL